LSRPRILADYRQDHQIRRIRQDK